MLTISGQINGKVLRDDVVTIEQLNEWFGISHLFDFVNKDDNYARIIFEYVSGVATNKNGRRRFPENYSLPTTFSAQFKGRQIKLTYAETEDPANTNPSIKKYLPRKVYFGSKEQKMMGWHENVELVYFWALHPKCKDSPFANPNDEVYRIKNSQKDASEFLEANKRALELKLEFMQGDINLLKRKALGIGLNFGSNYNDNVVRQQLILTMETKEKAGQFEAFYEQYINATTNVKGSILLLIEENIIEKKRTDHGTLWSFKSGTKYSGNITTVPFGNDAQDWLIQHISSNIGTYNDKIQHYLKTKASDDSAIRAFSNQVDQIISSSEAQGKGPKTVEEMTGKELIRELLADELIGFNKETSGVHYYNAKKFGELIKEPFFVVKEMKNWKVELADALNDPTQIALKAELNKKLIDYQNK